MQVCCLPPRILLDDSVWSDNSLSTTLLAEVTARFFRMSTADAATSKFESLWWYTDISSLLHVRPSASPWENFSNSLSPYSTGVKGKVCCGFPENFSEYLMDPTETFNSIEDISGQSYMQLTMSVHMFLQSWWFTESKFISTATAINKK